MRDVYVIGTSCTAFGKRPETGFKDLTREAYLEALADAGLETGAGGRSASRLWCARGCFPNASA